MIFGGFQRCLYPYQKFQSDPERVLAIVLDREAQKWFKPAQGQFQIHYRAGGQEQGTYVPDFVAESESQIYMLEVKARDEMTDAVVLAKQEAALQWCQRASAHSHGHGGKPWTYALIRDDLIAEHMTLAGLVRL
jgi:type III restriction enzyme